MKRLPIFGVLSFLIFVFFSFLVAMNLFVSPDFNATVKIQDFLGDGLVSAFSLFSLVGTVELASIILLVLLFFSKKLNKLYVLILYSFTGVFELLGKALIDQKGPPIQFLKTHFLIQMPSNYIPHDFFSYPSGHSARSAFISGIIILVVLLSGKMTPVQKKVIITGVLSFDFLMFLSRVYLGEHWLSDVIGGAALGFSLVLLASRFIVRKSLI